MVTPCRYSKKDFFTMLVTFLVTLFFETSIGLIVGLVLSILIFLAEVSFSKNTAPRVVHSHLDNQGTLVVRLEGDLTFLTSFRMKDLLLPYTTLEVKDGGDDDGDDSGKKKEKEKRKEKTAGDGEDDNDDEDIELGAGAAASREEAAKHGRTAAGNDDDDNNDGKEKERQDRADALHRKIGDMFDRVIPPAGGSLKRTSTPTLPQAVVLDLSMVKILDITGLHSMAEFSHDARTLGVLVAIVNTSPSVTAQMLKFGITSDVSNEEVNIDEYVVRSRIVLGVDDDDDNDYDYDESDDLLGGSGVTKARTPSKAGDRSPPRSKRQSRGGEYGTSPPRGTGTGLVMRPSAGPGDDLTTAARSPSDSNLMVPAPSTDEMLASTQAHPVSNSNINSNSNKQQQSGGNYNPQYPHSGGNNNPQQLQQRRQKKRTHREKYGLVDGTSLPATRVRSMSAESNASGDNETINVTRALSMDRKDLNQERLNDLLHGLSYDHNA
jgi:hypothetical protein